MEQCLISIDLANALKVLAGAMKLKVLKGLRCPKCGKPVRPHKAGRKQAAHFEHVKQNRDCSLSHRRRIRN
jgi:competence CoiA-like predicted nuclease